MELRENTVRRDQGRCQELLIGMMVSLRRFMCSCVNTDGETEVRAEYSSGHSGEELTMR